MDTGMTPMVWWSVIIINEAGLHRCTGGVAFRKVVNCWRMKLVQILHKFKSMAKSGCRDAEDVRKCLVVRRLELYQIW